MIKMDFPAGTGIRSAIESAKAAAVALRSCVGFKFNGITVQVNANTDTHALQMDYHKCCIETPRDGIGPGTMSPCEYKVVVTVYGEIEEVKTFINKTQRDFWMEGASYGADKYGGSLGLYHEDMLPENKNLRDNIWFILLSPAESEEST